MFIPTFYIHSQSLPFKLEKDSLSIQNYNAMLEMELNTVPVSTAKFETPEPIPNALKNVFDRIYIDNIGIDAFRENIDELLGRIAFKEDVIFEGDGVFNLGLLNIKTESAQIKSFVPKEGKLLSHKLTEKSSMSLSLFINASASNERIYEYYVSDISRAILKNKQINKELLKKLVNDIDDDENLRNYYLVTGVTVTEIFKREFNKKEKKIKANNFPILATAISFEGNFFVSDDNFEREYKIGLSTSRLDIVKKEVNALISD